MKRLLLATLFFLIILATVYSAAADLYINPTSIEFKGDYDDNIARSVYVENTGNTTLTGLSFSKSGLSLFTFSYSENNFNLAPGENKTIQISLTLPEENPIEYNGKITLGSSVINVSKDISTKVDLSEADTLIISRVEVDGNRLDYGETKTKIRPLESIDIEVTVENNLPDNEDEITDIMISVTIEDIEDGGSENIELESEDFDLDGDGDDKTLKLSFDVPYDIEHKEEYKVEILVEGEGEDEDYQVEWDVYIETRKERDLLRIWKYNIYPDEITCKQRYVEIDATCLNLGSNDQDDTVLEIKNVVLGINEEYKFEMESDPDKDDFEVQKSYGFSVLDDVAPGNYIIDLYLYYDVEKQIDHRTVTLTVPDCGQEDTDTDTQDTATSSQGTSSSGGTTNIQPGITPGISYSSESEGLRSSALYTALLVVIILAVVIGIVFMVVKLVHMF
ncbi:hypothetical protein KY312_03670 [Candidatus Woesearchaeota archaeon]|nr:hypothetical protein [Candidatus Woesearchaeota archaeon]